MDKAQVLYEFWSSFGLPAYDESSVPTGELAPSLPYITYNTITDSLGGTIPLHASVWYKSTSWAEITQKTDDIAEFIGGGLEFDVDGGYVTIYRVTPFAQRMSDPSDDLIRRMYLTVQAEFLTEY